MNIEGMSEATLQKFVENGILKNYSDIFEIWRHKQQIIEMDGFGEKSFSKLVEAIENAKKCRLSNFINSLSINQVGLSNAKLLCKHYNNDLDRIINSEIESLVSIDGFGEIIANSIYDYFKDSANKELIEKVAVLLEIEKEDIQEERLKLEGLNFVITGDVNIYKNRKELQEVIEQFGGKVTASVTKKTSYLINNHSTSESSKNKKATELGIKIMTEEEFQSFLNYI